MAFEKWNFLRFMSIQFRTGAGDEIAQREALPTPPLIETEHAEQPNAILRKRPGNERRKRARRAFAADAELYAARLAQERDGMRSSVHDTQGRGSCIQDSDGPLPLAIASLHMRAFDRNNDRAANASDRCTSRRTR